MKVTIYRKNDETKIEMPSGINPFKEGQLETVLEGVSAFGYLLPRNSRVSAGDFASLIEQNYSTENPKTADVVENLRALDRITT